MRLAIRAKRSPLLQGPAQFILAIALVLASLCVAQAYEACTGTLFKLDRSAGGTAPYIRLRADNRTGSFLLDYGATASSISGRMFPGGGGSIRISDFSLPTFSSGRFLARQYNFAYQPDGGLMGIIGTDFLSLLSAHFSFSPGRERVVLGLGPCDRRRLQSAGFVPVSQGGFFSADTSRLQAGRPNVPVLYLNLAGVRTWAQIDSGYDDRVYKHSIDVNAALFQRLRASGVQLRRIGVINVTTCSGSSQRHVYRAEGTSLRVTTENGRSIRRFSTFHIIPKAPGSCGGIATMNEPAAQIGASLLASLGEIVFDPKDERVWVRSR